MKAKNADVKPTLGRPNKFDAVDLKMVTRMCLLGMVDTELAIVLEVSIETIDKWKNAHPTFLQAIKKGREDADGKVVAALHKRARGFYKHEEIVTKDGPQTIRKYFPPDPVSMIFYLKNRQRKRWRDKHEVEHSSDSEKPIVIRLEK